MLRNDRELANTRERVRVLEERYEEFDGGASQDEELSEAELESLKRLINQLKEEIARCEAHQLAQ